MCLSDMVLSDGQSVALSSSLVSLGAVRWGAKGKGTSWQSTQEVGDADVR